MHVIYILITSTRNSAASVPASLEEMHLNFPESCSSVEIIFRTFPSVLKNELLKKKDKKGKSRKLS